MSRAILLCESAEHAQVVDQFICLHLRDVDGNRGNQWSGVLVRVNEDNSQTYGILWDTPGKEVFGDPEEDSSMVLVDEVLTQGEEGMESDWRDLPPPKPEESEV